VARSRLERDAKDPGLGEKAVRVSIIIPCYNMKQYVAEAIESAMLQTYRDREVIVVNDGSTDGSLGEIEKFPVKFINKPNGGLSAARNDGINFANGDLILPLDADDKIDPCYLERTVPLMQNGVGVVSTDMMYFGTHSKRLPPTHTTLAQITRYNGIPVCSLIRKRAIIEAGGYKPIMKEGCEDWNLWVDILKRGWTVAVLNEPLFFYRRKPTSMASTMNRGRMIEVMKSLHPELIWSAR
jgi:glycosyltransferase involved in cell wall biosynthesis